METSHIYIQINDTESGARNTCQGSLMTKDKAVFSKMNFGAF